VKARLLLTSALFVFVQIPAQAQVSVDVSKITCEQVLMEKLAWTEKEIVLWFNHYCYEHRDTTVMDAVKNVLGWDK